MVAPRLRNPTCCGARTLQIHSLISSPSITHCHLLRLDPLVLRALSLAEYELPNRCEILAVSGMFEMIRQLFDTLMMNLIVSL
jgi:hypothetical protein